MARGVRRRACRLSTPKSSASVLVLAVTLFLTAPLVVARYFFTELQKGSFPPESDSIGIPIFHFAAALVATAPVTWGIVWFCVRNYPGSVSLHAWNAGRPIWSAIWTLVAVVAAVAFLVFTPWSDAADHPFLIAHVLLDTYFLLVLRSGLVAQSKASVR